jgi:hypothetical protein
MHEDEPIHGQPLAESGSDSGSMFNYPTTNPEERHCSSWVQFQPDEIINQYFLIKNITLGFLYNSSGESYGMLERYATYDYEGDYENLIPSSSSHIFNTTNFTELNITSDYPWRFYWLSIKLVGDDPSVISNATQQSYADISYLYTGPEIKELRETNGSDIRNVQFLSSYFDDDNQTIAKFDFDSSEESYINFSVQMPNESIEYDIYYDDVLCSINSNCTINSNSDGQINVTLRIASPHELSIEGILPIPTKEETTSPSFGGFPTYSPSQTDLNKGYRVSLAKNYKVNLKVNNQSHQLKVNNISNGSVTITISSNPQIKTLKNGESWMVDLNADDVYDYKIVVSSLTNFLVGLVISSSDEKVVKNSVVDVKNLTEEDGVVVVEEDSVLRTYIIWLAVLIAILALGILGFVFWKKKGSDKIRYNRAVKRIKYSSKY